MMVIKMMAIVTTATENNMSSGFLGDFGAASMGSPWLDGLNRYCSSCANIGGGCCIYLIGRGTTAVGVDHLNGARAKHHGEKQAA